MTRWLRRIEPKMTLEGIPAGRRHFYFFVALFLITAAADNAWVNSNNSDTGFASSPDAQELVRLQEMAATARDLYE